MTIEGLITELRSFITAGLPPETTVYVPEKTNLAGQGWRSPHELIAGFDPHPISAPHPAPMVVYIR